MSTTPTSGVDLYVHIPFCTHVCAYCAYVAEPFDAGRAARYVEALERELASLPADLRPVSLAVGGGTPSALPGPLLDRLLDRLASRFVTASPALRAFTFEVNPEDVETELVDRLLRAGVNRISLGVQSLADGELRALGRQHDARTAAGAVRRVVAAGFPHVSVDLLTGVVGQTPDTLRRTLDGVLDLGAGHVEVFGLDPGEPGAELRPTWSPGERRAWIGARAAEFGLEHYELNALALPGQRSLHRIRRALRIPLHAVGAGAFSFTDGRTARRVPDARDYVERVSRETSVIDSTDRPLPDDAELERILAGLHLREGVAAHALPASVSERIEAAERSGWIEIARSRAGVTRVRLTDAGWVDPDRAFEALLAPERPDFVM